jgi:SNF2 family DNA or RNA helicase
LIKIQVSKSNHFKSEESLFVSFPYSMERVKKIKDLKDRYYHGAITSWEVPVAYINEILNSFSDEEIQITANTITEAPQVIETPKKEEKKFDQVDISSFQFKTTPFDHQVEALQYAQSNPKFLLGDEQGLGKTKQAIDIAVSRKAQFKHCLIVCGVNSLKYNWVKEVAIHSNESGRIIGSYFDKNGKIKEGSLQDRLTDLEDIDDVEDFFLITNVETLRDVPKKNKNGTVKKLSKMEETQEAILKQIEKLIEEGTIGMVIVDEIHKCKNPQSQQGRAIKRLNSFYKMAMTGTPLMNKPLDLYVPLNWLGVEDHSYYQFEKRYAVKGGFGGYEIVGYKNTDELRSNLEGIMLRRKKVEVLNLPPKIRQTEYVELTDGQKKLYKDVLNQVKKNMKEIALDPNPLAQLLRLRQVTGWTGLLSDEIQESAKMDRMMEIVEELAETGKKAIVFSNWTEMTKIAKDKLKDFNPAYITGEIDNATRMNEVERFQKDPNCKVIIGTIGAMGTGLTLTAAETVIFLDKPWNPANTEQAEDRAHRIGTTGTVNIITLVAKDTIDERIEEILAEKGDIFDALIDGAMEKMSKYEIFERLIA